MSLNSRNFTWDVLTYICFVTPSSKIFILSKILLMTVYVYVLSVNFIILQDGKSSVAKVVSFRFKYFFGKTKLFNLFFDCQVLLSIVIILMKQTCESFQVALTVGWIPTRFPNKKIIENRNSECTFFFPWLLWQQKWNILLRELWIILFANFNFLNKLFHAPSNAQFFP